MTPLRRDHKACFKARAHRNLPIVVQRMKLGLLLNEFFSSGLDRVEIRQVQREKENVFLPCAALKFIDRSLCLFRGPSGKIHSSSLLQQYLRKVTNQREGYRVLGERESSLVRSASQPRYYHQ